MKKLIKELSQIEHGFKHINEAGDKLLKDKKQDYLKVADKLTKNHWL